MLHRVERQCRRGAVLLLLARSGRRRYTAEEREKILEPFVLLVRDSVRALAHHRPHGVQTVARRLACWQTGPVVASGIGGWQIDLEISARDLALHDTSILNTPRIFSRSC
jgi:hypothetical protein